MPDADSQVPQALILTAGLGTRLQPLTHVRAKAAVPINGQPLVRRVISSLAAAGIRDLVLNLHHRPATIAALIGDGSGDGVRVRYSWEQPVLGSAGGPRHALPLVARNDDDDFLIVNGDTLTDLDIAAIVRHHQASGSLVTMALIPNPAPGKYGGVAVSDAGRVTGFVTRRAAALDPKAPLYHFIGVQVAKRRAFAGLEDGVPAESVGALYPQLIARDPDAVSAHVSGASFLDIGTPRDCMDTCLALAEREGAHLIGARAQIASSAVVERSAIWDDVTVGPEAHLHECIVGDGVSIPGGARFERCAIVPADGLQPGPGERIDGALLISQF